MHAPHRSFEVEVCVVEFSMICELYPQSSTCCIVSLCRISGAVACCIVLIFSIVFNKCLSKGLHCFVSHALSNS